MPALIEEIRFTNLAAAHYDFVPNGNQRVTKFEGAIAPRGSDTSRMGMHGFNPRRTLFDGMQISHEGLFLAAAGAVADAGQALIAERDAMLAVLLGDLDDVPDGTSLGTLTVKLAGWTETASAPAQVSSWSASLDSKSVRTAAYMIGWTLATPYLLGDSTSALKVI
jgi:hypothetical protein